MHIKKKAEYYTPPDNYRDLDGNLKTFTYVDHDKKITTGGYNISDSFSEWENLKKDIDFTNKKVIDYCNTFWDTSYEELTIEILDNEYIPLYLLKELKQIL